MPSPDPIPAALDYLLDLRALRTPEGVTPDLALEEMGDVGALLDVADLLWEYTHQTPPTTLGIA